MRIIALLSLIALAGCASSPQSHRIVAPSPSPMLTPPYARDHCGEDITPTHPATPDAAPCN